MSKFNITMKVNGKMVTTEVDTSPEAKMEGYSKALLAEAKAGNLSTCVINFKTGEITNRKKIIIKE